MKSTINKLIVLACAFVFAQAVFAYQSPIPQGKSINKEAINKAIAEYNATIVKDPAAQSAYVDRAFLNYLLGNVKAALDDYNKLISLNPNNEEYYLNRGYLKHISNDRAGALEDYNSALKIKPNYAFAHNNRGVVLSELGKDSESLDAYNTAIKIDPNYADAYYNRGNLMTKTDKNEEALADYSTAIKLNPTDSASYNNRGVVKRKLNYDVGALSDFSIAIRINPEDITALSNRGHLKKRFFDSEGAEEDFSKAIAAADTSPVLVKQVEIQKEIEDIQRSVRAEIKPQKTEDGIQKIADNVTSKGSSSAIKANVVKVEPKTGKATEIPVVAQKETPKIEAKPVENPQLAECYYIRGLQKYILQNRDAALADLDMAIKYNPNYAEAYYYRAAIKRDMKADFVDDYQKAVAIDPSLKSVNDSDVLMILKM